MFNKDKIRRLLLAVALLGIGVLTGRSELIASGTSELVNSVQQTAVETEK